MNEYHGEGGVKKKERFDMIFIGQQSQMQ